jgi:hypothetical protein
MFIPDPTTPTKDEGEKIVVRKNLSWIQGSKRLRIPDFGSGSATLVSTVLSLSGISKWYLGFSDIFVCPSGCERLS